ncbi:MAG: DUF3179 domain-containing protein [Chloroflexi bacterium]|nr:DUF3179 domain-containing protein [Chloroflexota bacterium]
MVYAKRRPVGGLLCIWLLSLAACLPFPANRDTSSGISDLEPAGFVPTLVRPLVIPNENYAQSYSPVAAIDWLQPNEPVLVVSANQSEQAFPLQIMVWHLLVEGEIGGVPVAISYDPLVNHAVAFDRRINGVAYHLMPAGETLGAIPLLQDQETGSLWSQITGAALRGPATGQILRPVPLSWHSWRSWSAANPQGLVLLRPASGLRAYGLNPYPGYARQDNPPNFVHWEPDNRLSPMEMVAGLDFNGDQQAFSFAKLETEGAVNTQIGGYDIALFFDPQTASPLDDRYIAAGPASGSVLAYDAHVDGKRLTFFWDHLAFRDLDTGSTWDINGRAVGGPLQGQRLKPALYHVAFWFAWSQAYPKSRVN